MENPAIAALFDEMADLLELDSAVVFRVRAYRNAARVIRDQGSPLRDQAADLKALMELEGIGKDLAEKIQSIVQTGDFPAHRELAAKFPPGLLDLLRVPGLGPKRVKQLHDELEIRSLDDLRKALEQGRLVTVRGFGQRSVDKLKEQLEKAAVTQAPRMLLAEAETWVAGVLEHMRKGGFRQVEAEGSYRRRRETIGDLDILVATDDPSGAGEHFLKYAQREETLASGGGKTSIRLKGGPQVDLRTVAPDQWGAAQMYFTGSKQHNIELRKIAQAKDQKLSEYGLFHGEERVASETEEEVYRALGLAWIPPELREARREIELARQNRLPRLVELGDIRGELHAHTTATDGKASLDAMVTAARKRGYGYLAITDHSQRVTMAFGLDAERLREQWGQIDAVNTGLRDFAVLKAVELDILDDGTLDLPDDVLAEADYVVASIHYGAGNDAGANTRRLVAAAGHPHVDALGHPTGRVLNRRDGYPLDFDEIVAACAGEGCLLELNGHVERMDLPDHLAMSAAAKGVRFVCATDSHSVANLDTMAYAVSIARRAGLTKEQVVNTRELAAFRNAIKRGS